MSQQLNRSENKARTGIIGAVVGAIAASICCIGPLVLFALGIGGAWVSTLTVLEPYRPFLIGITLIFLGYAFYRVYRTPAVEECEDGSVCATSNSARINKISLWIVTVVILALIAFPYIVPMPSAASSGIQQVQTQQASHVPDNAQKETVVLNVEGMTCNGCVLTVHKSLKTLPGVLKADITLKPPRAVVEIDPTLVKPEQLVEATKNAGYPSTILKSTGEDHE